MNDLTIGLIREVWPERRRTSFERLKWDVQWRYAHRIQNTVGGVIMDRAVRLARQLRPACFDPADVCDNCALALARQMDHFFQCVFLPRHPEWELSEFGEEELRRLGFEIAHDRRERRTQRRASRNPLAGRSMANPDRADPGAVA